MQILKKILNAIINILIVLLLAISVLVAALALASKSGGVPSVLGYVPLSVQSDSMIPEFEKGDLIISKAVDDSTALEKGDIITYQTTIEGEKVLNTHRIVDVTETDGFVFYTTKGDNNDIEDAELLTLLPKGIYVCIRYNGVHKDAPKYYHQLLDYIEEKGYNILDDSVEIQYIDPNLTNNEKEYINEIQILVDKKY